MIHAIHIHTCMYVYITFSHICHKVHTIGVFLGMSQLCITFVSYNTYVYITFCHTKFNYSMFSVIPVKSGQEERREKCSLDFQKKLHIRIIRTCILLTLDFQKNVHTYM